MHYIFTGFDLGMAVSAFLSTAVVGVRFVIYVLTEKK